MNRDELIQKLVVEVASHQSMILSLLGVLAIHLAPDDPEKGYEQIGKDWVRAYKSVRLNSAKEMAEEWGLPLSLELQADIDLDGSAFKDWFRNQMNEMDGDQP